MRAARRTARAIALTGATGLLSVAVMGAPASADTRQDGLVNLALTNTTVQVPVSVAANVCGVAVNVLASQLRRARSTVTPWAVRRPPRSAAPAATPDSAG